MTKQYFLVMEETTYHSYKLDMIDLAERECKNLSWALGMAKVFELIFNFGKWRG